MLTKNVKLCILTAVIVAVILLLTENVAATTTTATLAAEASTTIPITTTDNAALLVKQNKMAAKIWPEMQRAATPTATLSATSTSTATPTTTATTSTTTTTTAATTIAAHVVAPHKGNETDAEISSTETTAAKPEVSATTATAKLMMPQANPTAAATPSLRSSGVEEYYTTTSTSTTTTTTPVTTELSLPENLNNLADSAVSSYPATSSYNADNEDALHIQMQAAASYQVAETLADLNEEERARYGAMLAQQPTASKLNIVDLYPMKLEDFQPIIRDANEQLLRERTIFTQPENVEEYRQNLMPNEVDMLVAPKLTVNQPTTTAKTAATTTTTSATTTTMTTNNPAASARATVSDFTGKLLAEQDDLITEIERKFQLHETTAAPTTSSSSTTTRTRLTTTRRAALPPLAAGDSYIDRRVKKSFEFPLHRASDVMAMPHIDFANTKFNTDVAAEGYGKTGTATSASSAAATLTAAAHPEFSTTKFYNSKELYNEMLLHNKRKLMKTVTTSPSSFAALATTVATKAASPELATPLADSGIIKSSGVVAAEELSKSLVKSSLPEELQVIRTSDPTKLSAPTATAATSQSTLTPAAATADTFRSVTLTPTTQSFAVSSTTTTTTTAAESATSTALPLVASTTLKPKKYQKELKRAKLLLKAILPPATKMPGDLDNLEVVGAKVEAAATTTTTAAAAGTTDNPVSPSAGALSPHRYTANPTKSASKPIARPRILSRLQEKINSLECEIQNVPQDSHLWRGNETHELLLPIVTTEHCKPVEKCTPNVVSWQGEAEIQSGDILIVEINDAMLNPTHEPNNTSSAAHALQVYQVTRSGHEHCDVTEGVLLDITPLVVDGRKLVTLYDKDLTEGVNLLIVVSELWGAQCVRLKVTTKTDNCGENADCSGKGVCYSNAAMEEYECQCCSGFAGPHCEEIDACNPSPCTNNGICVDLSQGHEGNSYQCLCPYGYAGKNCQYESDPCNPAECMNGGSCVGNSTHFRCDCTPGYTGPLCQHSLNECESSPCVHGICVDQEDGFRCFCQPGFAGELCNFEYNECESNPCQNAGECIDHIGSYECRCSKGYTGNRCQIKVDFCANKPCPEGHHCIDHGNDFSCECPGGRNGPDCNQMPRTYFQQCNVNPCTHGGTCWSSGDSFYCACRPGYTGTMCEDEFVVETVVSSSEFIVDDANARNFNDKTFGSSVVLKSPIELHNAYFAAGVLAAAIFIVAVVVTICHCKVNQTYRKFSTRSTSFIPILGFSRRPKMQGKLNKHWLSGKGLGGGGGATPSAASGTQRSASSAAAQSTRHLPCQPNGSNTQTQTTLGGQLHERPFQRHLAMNLENDMYYTVDFSENSQHSPLIQ